MNPTLKRIVVFLGDTIRTLLMAVGIITVFNFSKERWPDATTVFVIALISVQVGLFLWFAVAAPFLAGYREERPTDDHSVPSP